MIFPDWGTSPTQKEAAALPLFTEWAVDWDAGCFALRNGQPYTVTGTDALKIWVYRAVHPESRRFLYSAYSSDYGNQLLALMGEGGDSGILENRMRKEIREALTVSPYIRSVDAFSFSRQGSRMTVSFTVHSIYEDFDEEVLIL